MLNEFLTLNIFGFFLIFSRVGTALMLLPGFSAIYVSPRIRLSFALAMCLVLLPFLQPILPPLPPSAAELVLLIAAEVVIGGFLGALSRVVVGAIQTAGTLISMFSSLANALVQDAITEQQSSVVSGFLASIALVLIFVMNLHHLMIEAIIETYVIFKPGVIESLGDFAMMMARGVAKSFALGLQLSTPFLVVAIVYYVGLGLMGRLMPGLPMFFFMMPIQITVQIIIMISVLSGLMLIFLRHFEDTFMMFTNP